MKLTSRATLAALFVLCMATLALADVRLPDEHRPKGNSNSSNSRNANISRMTIEARDGVEGSRLQIPRRVLRQLRADIDGEDSQVAAWFGGGASPLQTVVAGVFLSLAVVFSGVWLVRTKRRALARRVATLAIALCALCATAAATAVVMANIGPPPRTVYYPDTLPQAVQDGTMLEGPVKVEIVDSGTEIKLIVPKAAGEK